MLTYRKSFYYIIKSGERLKDAVSHFFNAGQSLLFGFFASAAYGTVV